MNKQHRLCKNEQILGVINSKQKKFAENINIFYKENDLKNWRIAIIASKKNFPLAVIRNRIKRQAKAMIREINFPFPSLDIVLVIKSNWIQATYQENKEKLKNIFSKLIK